MDVFGQCVQSFSEMTLQLGSGHLVPGQISRPPPGVTQTMPLAIYTAFNGAGVTQGTAVALSLLLLVTALAVLLLVRGWRGEAPRRGVPG